MSCLRSLAAAVACASVLLGAAPPSLAADPEPAAARLLEAYIYGYAPVAMAATRALMTAVPAPSQGRAPVNQLARAQRLAGPEARLVPRPNADTLYAIAWLDLAREPMVLRIPAMKGRYHLVALYDVYSNQFASLHSRAPGDRASDFAILGPSWKGSLPEGVAPVRAPTDWVWLIARTLARGDADLDAAVSANNGYALVPLSAYAGFAASGIYHPPADTSVTPPDPDFTGLPVTRSRGFSQAKFFDLLSEMTRRNPPPAAERETAERLVRYGLAHKAALTPAIVAGADAAMLRELARRRSARNGWSMNLTLGTYGTDYLYRAAIARFGLGAIIAADAVYPSASKDAAGEPLTGAKTYRIHFPPGQTPPVQGFWSLTVYDESGFLVANPIHRYVVGSETGLAPNDDGSIDILLSSGRPPSRESNWLPIPRGAFNLTLRLYGPEQPVLDGSYSPPPVRPGNP